MLNAVAVLLAALLIAGGVLGIVGRVRIAAFTERLRRPGSVASPARGVALTAVVLLVLGISLLVFGLAVPLDPPV